MPAKQITQLKVPVSFCLIGKNERKNVPILHKSLELVLGHPDDEIIYVDTGSTDNTAQVARNKGWKVFLHPELADLPIQPLLKKYLPNFNKDDESLKHVHFKGGLMRSFAEARQISFDYAQNKVCMWLDLDDSIVNPGNLRPAIDRVFGDGVGGALMMVYEYAKDKADNQIVTQLHRERVVTKADFEWKGACHETLIPRHPDNGRLRMTRIKDWPCRIEHRYHKPSAFSDVRNYLIMRRDLEKQHDPRTLFYLGNACRGIGYHQEAVDWYNRFAGQSGSKDDVICARLSAATCLNNMGRHWKALEQAWEAQRVRPEDPRVYYFMADCWFNLGHYRNTIIHIKIGDQFEMPDTMHAVDPTSLGFLPSVLGASAARELNEPDMAVMFAERALKERPNLELAQKRYKDMIEWANAQQASRAVAAVVQQSTDPIETAKLVRFSPHMLLQGIGTPEDKDDGRVAFYCGHSADTWGPPEVMRGKGIGASEKMVYEAARGLASRGIPVTVYAPLPRQDDEGVYEGVSWKFSARFNPKVYREHLVIWRMPQLVDKMPFNADHIHVWMHDMGFNAVWTPEILALTDTVWFLSKWQRNLHPSVPEDKVFYTRNGIDLKKHLYDGREKKKHVIFCSSPDRGFQTAINVFKESGLADEGYELHLYYGFGKTWRHLATEQEYAYVVELNKEMRLLEYEDQCLELAANTPGVVFKGSVDWATMAEAEKDAEIWLYPTNFGEISCVAAMEAMAAGCKCVATDSAALAETLKGYPGWRNLGNHARRTWGEVLRLEVATYHYSPAAWAEHARKFDISTLVDQWMELFNGSESGDDNGEAAEA